MEFVRGKQGILERSKNNNEEGGQISWGNGYRFGFYTLSSKHYTTL
jgi:hypothetical protein